MTYETLESLYGLPADVRYCSRCVMSNQRPSSTVEFKNVDKKDPLEIDDQNVCSACRQHERKWETIDYEARQKTLTKILDQHRSKDGSYDMIIPGSGGKDSMYVAHVMKHKYGMHPLTVTWPPHMYTNIGRKNMDAFLRHFDNISLSPAGDVHRLLTREAFLNLLHPFQPFILGQKSIGPRMAMKYGIKLVMYGENESEGGSRIDPNNPIMEPRFFSVPRAKQKDIFLGKHSYENLLKMGLTHSDLLPYLPLALEDIKTTETSVYYMSYFENWRSQEKYYYAMENCGFEPHTERTDGTFTKFCGLDDKIDGLQYYTTYVKFGIGRATYDASQEIRHRYIDRDEGVALVHKFDGEFPKTFHQDCLEYMNIDEDQFWAAIDHFRSPHLWTKENNEWKLRRQVS